MHFPRRKSNFLVAFDSVLICAKNSFASTAAFYFFILRFRFSRLLFSFSFFPLPPLPPRLFLFFRSLFQPARNTLMRRCISVVHFFAFITRRRYVERFYFSISTLQLSSKVHARSVCNTDSINTNKFRRRTVITVVTRLSGMNAIEMVWIAKNPYN